MNLLRVKELLVDRFPVPRCVVPQHGGSQARFLLSKLNPSTTHVSGAGFGRPSAQAIFIDDVNLQTFIEHLKKYHSIKNISLISGWQLQVQVEWRGSLHISDLTSRGQLHCIQYIGV